MALKFGPAEVCSLMLLGLLAGSTLARGSPIKGVAMTVLGLIFGLVGSDLETGAERLTFGFPELDDGIELVALALGLFGIAEFMNSVNQTGADQHASTPTSSCATCGRARPSSSGRSRR